MAKIDVIRKGESLPFCFSRDGESIADWICTIKVKQYPADTALIERIIAPSNTTRTWPGFLTATETAALAESSTSPYTLVGILTNSATDETTEVPLRFNVVPTWAT